MSDKQNNYNQKKKFSQQRNLQIYRVLCLCANSETKKKKKEIFFSPKYPISTFVNQLGSSSYNKYRLYVTNVQSLEAESNLKESNVSFDFDKPVFCFLFFSSKHAKSICTYIYCTHLIFIWWILYWDLVRQWYCLQWRCHLLKNSCWCKSNLCSKHIWTLFLSKLQCRHCSHFTW